MKKVFIFLLFIATIYSCKQESLSQEATSPKSVASFGCCGLVYKIKIDSVEYVIVKNGSDGAAIIKHSK